MAEGSPGICYNSPSIYDIWWIGISVDSNLLIYSVGHQEYQTCVLPIRFHWHIGSCTNFPLLNLLPHLTGAKELKILHQPEVTPCIMDSVQLSYLRCNMAGTGICHDALCNMHGRKYVCTWLHVDRASPMDIGDFIMMMAWYLYGLGKCMYMYSYHIHGAVNQIIKSRLIWEDDLQNAKALFHSSNNTPVTPAKPTRKNLHQTDKNRQIRGEIGLQLVLIRLCRFGVGLCSGRQICRGEIFQTCSNGCLSVICRCGVSFVGERSGTCRS